MRDKKSHENPTDVLESFLASHPWRLARRDVHRVGPLPALVAAETRQKLIPTLNEVEVASEYLDQLWHGHSLAVMTTAEQRHLFTQINVILQGGNDPPSFCPWHANKLRTRQSESQYDQALHRFTFSGVMTERSKPMCNLYSHKSNRQAIIDFVKATRVAEQIGNLAPMPGIFPDYPAAIVRNAEGDRELAMARWGMPSPRFVLEGKNRDPGVTNIRNTASPHWRRWLGPTSRCIVPFTSFSEFNKAAGGDIWFAFDESRPLAFFAGIYVNDWTSVRKVKTGEETADLFGFLTTEPNAEVGQIHPKAMPVILTEPDEIDMWLNAEWDDAKHLQRPLPDGSLQIVARGVMKDDAA